MAQALVSVNFTSYVSATNAEGFVLGQKYTDPANGNEYRFVKNGTDGAITQGMACVWTSAPTSTLPTGTGLSIVTYANGASQLSQYASAGLAIPSTIAVSNYFFMLVSGAYAFAVDASNGVTNGSFVTGKNVNGNFINGVAGQVNKEIGFALANAAGGVFAIRVTVG